ncbi:hypothetical protein ACQJBY_057304 [Aegilops geniculata]
MNAGELQKLEEELKNRESIIRTREEELKRLAAEQGKATVAPSPATIPAPSSYVASIKTYVPITLDLQDSNYSKWRELFLVALGRYGLSSHVIGDAAATPSDTSPTSDWGRDDYTVLSWIYGSISIELFGIIMAPGSTARQVWDSIANLFHDNKKSRALALDAEFRNTPQGDMSIHDYCAKLKSLSDALGDVGITISDETLVLTVLRGLNEQFSHLRSFLPFQVPFPSFLQTRSALVLEEAQKKTDAKNAAATALWASGNSILPSAGGERAPLSGGGHSYGAQRPVGPSSSSSNSGGRGTFSNNRSRGRGGRGRGCSKPWMYNPWTGLPTRAQLYQHPAPAPWQSQPWRAPGVLGPRPAAASPQAYAAYGPAPTTPTYNGHQQQLDPALLNALNNMHLPGNQEWYMDTGASSHMASNHGVSFQGRDPSLQ